MKKRKFVLFVSLVYHLEFWFKTIAFKDPNVTLNINVSCGSQRFLFTIFCFNKLLCEKIVFHDAVYAFIEVSQ